VLAYFAKRLLLIIPTFLGITAVLFLITRLVPGGPIEEAINAHAPRGDGYELLVKTTAPACAEKIVFSWLRISS